jgi:predicted 2-oxoglutarate/Fe(II)-dependent dioxygenase YbiX
MHWAFVRAYSPSRRLQFPVHRDSSVVTANILLSPPSAFSGAELYVLGPAFTGVDKLSDREFRKKLPEAALRREHSLDYQQGECVMHLGKRMHGVLPITKGTRHTLILMFYEKK